MNKLISLILTFTLFPSLMLPAFATSNSEPILSEQATQISTIPIQKDSTLHFKTSSTGEQYLLNTETGEKVIQVFSYNKNGELIEIPLSEYKKIKDAMPTVPEVSATDNISLKLESDLERAITWSYHEKRSYIGYGSPLKISADMKGPGQISTIQSTSVSYSFGGDVSISGTIKKIIQAGASFTWNVTLMSEASNSYQFDTIPAGKIGYIQFTPYLNVTIGDLYKGHSESSLPDTYMGEVWGQSPIKTATGFADGLYELVIK